MSLSTGTFHLLIYFQINRSHMNYVCRRCCVLEFAASAVVARAMVHGLLTADNLLVYSIRLRCHPDSVAMIVVDVDVVLDSNCMLFLLAAIVP